MANNAFCRPLFIVIDRQLTLWDISGRQNTFLSSATFMSSGNARTAAWAAPSMMKHLQNIPFAQDIQNPPCSPASKPAEAAKSELRKTGRSKIVANV